MSSFPPAAPDPSRPPNPFEAPPSSYQPEARAYVPGEPRVVEFGDLWSKTFQAARSQGFVFLLGTVVAATLLAAFTAAFHAVAGDSVVPPYDFPKYFFWQSVLAALQIPLLVWLFCGMTKVWLDATAGEEPQFERLFTSVRWWPVAFGVSLIVDLVWAVASLFCCFPGFFVAAAGGAAYSVVVAEGRGVFDSLQRSYDLALPSLTAIALAFFYIACLSLAVLVPMTFLGNLMPQAVVDVAATVPLAVTLQYLVVLKVVSYRLTSGAGVVLAGEPSLPPSA